MAERPFSSGSIISPHAALEALAARDGIDIRDSLFQPRLSSYNPPRTQGSTSSSTSSRSLRASTHAQAQAQTQTQMLNGRQLHTPPLDDEPPRIFVRAKFRFEATDPSALSFDAGDVIEVFTKLDSGWWDGMLGTVRGWFPSNFVEVIDSRIVLGPSGPLPPIPTDVGSQEEVRSEVGYEGSVRERDVRDSGQENIGWGDVMGRQGWDDGLDDLAREVMRGAGDDFGISQRLRQPEDDENDFESIAADRRRRQGQGSNNQAYLEAMQDLGPEEMDEFGVRSIPGQRVREDTNQTIRGLEPSALSPGRNGTGREEIDLAEGDEEKDGQRSDKGMEESAWIPSLTPDGQIYYHNTITGEDSWHLPPATPSHGDRDSYYQEDNNFYNTFTGSSSAAFGNQSSTIPTPESGQEEFRLPQLQSSDLPIPWIAKLSDDGREWYYFNRVTGQTQKEKPGQEDFEGRMERLSVGSSNILPIRPTRPKVRHSVDLKRKAVEEWKTKTRAAFDEVLTQPKPHTMGWLMETVQDGIREVFEAAVAGSAAEEEYSRALAIGQEEDVMAAISRTEAAIEMLRKAHASVLAKIRSLLSAFGYVGPGDGMLEMPRPRWTGDLSLVGAMGGLSTSVHAALYSRKVPEGGMSNWTEVMRSAHKLKDIVSGFPGWVTPNAPNNVQDAVEGKLEAATFGVDTAGTILSGRWGFGTLQQAEGLKPLNDVFVHELRIAKEGYDAVKDDGDILDIIRAASSFKLKSLEVDIAAVIDIDGDMSDRTKEGDAKMYDDLLLRVGNALLDLEEAIAAIDELSIVLLHQSEVDPNLRARLAEYIASGYNATSALLTLSNDQKLLTERANLKSQIGHRSPRFILPKSNTARPNSIISTLSRLSRRSRVIGLEEEVLDGNEGGSTENDLEAAERRDRAGDLASASTNGSQTSLSQQQGQGQGRRGDVSAISAASSSTSLAYGQTESDGGSVRGKRSSLMKFMKGRSSTDDDGRSTRKGTSKKLAKLLGEDPYSQSPNSYPSVPGPLPLNIPETPWYLGEDYPKQDLLLDDKGSVRGGTLRALVARLTPHGSTDTSFFQAFLLTFRTFTSGMELVGLLIERYHIRMPDGLTAIEQGEWKKLKQTPIRLRVSNVMRSWLDVHYLEAEDSDILDSVEDFASTTLLENGSELLSRQLVALCKRRRAGESDTRRIVSGGLLSPPAPLVPRVAKSAKLKLLDINPLELARQLTIIESQSFHSVRPVELLNKVWQDHDRPHVAPGVRYMIKLANLMSVWVSATILGVKDLRGRSSVLKYFIQVSMHLREMNNFSTLASVMAGMNSAPILRLKRTQELISQKTKMAKTEMDKLMDSTKNFAHYKEMLKTVNPPTVPFLGFWLSALTFIEDGNKDYISRPSDQSTNPTKGSSGITQSASQSSLASTSNRIPNLSASTSTAPTSLSAPTNGTTTDSQPKLINFFKRQLHSEILRDIQQYQSQPYNLARCTIVAEWITAQLEELEKNNPDMTTLYDVSLMLEPREREEERITRMLHDSGFI